MKSKKYELLIDIYKGILNNQLIEFTTEDAGKCELEFNLLEDRITPYDLTGCLLRMVIQGQQQDCTIVEASGGKAKITLLQSMFTTPGFVVAELQIYDATNQTLRLTTPRFKYNVRKSLMDDNAVEADPNFSILQNMIINVTNADATATEALNKANQAVTTSNQAVTTINNQVTKVNQAVTNANEALERAGDVATQEELDAKITLGDVPQTNFNFMRQKIEQDGLLGLIDGVGELKVSGDIITVISCVTISSNTASSALVALGTAGALATTGATTSKLSLKFTSGDVVGYNIGYTDKPIYIEQIYNNSTLKSIINLYDSNLNRIYSGDEKTFGLSPVNSVRSVKSILIDTYNTIIYNRTLTPQEIQHNFSVLNNSESINALEVTDVDGTSKKLLLSSDEDHVSMSTGRTLRQEYMGVLKTMGKEFISTDGSPITVNNGIEARLISGEIQGQTVKNEVTSYTARVMNKTNNYTTTTVIANTIQASKRYTAIYIVKDFVGSGNVYLYSSAGHNSMPGTTIALANGILKKLYTPSENIQAIGVAVSNRSDDFSVLISGVMILEGDWTNKDIGYFTGLSSTQAIINNNGNLYPIYEPTIVGKTRILNDQGLEVDTGLVPTDTLLPPLKDGDVLDLATKTITFANKTTKVLTDEEVKAYRKFKKLISLGGLEGARNTLELLEDGSVILTPISKRVLIEDGTSIIFNSNTTSDSLNAICYYVPIGGDASKMLALKCNNFTSKVWNSEQAKNGEKGIYISGIASINFAIPKTELVGWSESLTDEQKNTILKNYLINTKTEFIYPLSVPVVTHIPKELVPAIPINKINICKVEGPVAPSSFKIVAPIDKVAEMETRLQALEAKTNTMAVNVPFIEETYQSSKNKINEVMGK